MIVLVCGGREMKDTRLVYETLTRLHRKKEITRLVCGGARGADKIGAFWALDNYVDLETKNAKWNELGKSAGVVRNRAMVQDFKPDLVVVFPGGFGTESMKNIAEEYKIEVLIVPPEPH